MSMDLTGITNKNEYYTNHYFSTVFEENTRAIFGYTDDAEDSHTTIRQKDKIFSELYKSEHMKNAGPYARLKFAMDYWCALWFWPIDKADLLPTRSEFLFDMSLILEGTMASVNVTDSVKGGQLSLFPTEMEQMAMRCSTYQKASRRLHCAFYKSRDSVLCN